MVVNGARFLGVLVGVAALAAPTAASAVVVPNGGSTFDTSTDGWGSVVATCQPAGGSPSEECTAANSHDGAVGNPPGSLRSRMTQGTRFVTFTSEFTWRSPSFTVPGDPGDPVDGAEFSYDRRFNAGGLSTLQPRAETTATLVNEATGDRVELTDETVNDGPFATRTAAVGAGGLTAWEPHHIELQASVGTTSTQGLVLGPADVHFDNVRLDVPDPPGNSAGVTFPRPPVSNAEIVALMQSLDLNALSGDGPGGSLAPIGECTILGTDGADRIRGTSANDVICGLGGNDRIIARRGRDVIDTGAGNDRAQGGQGHDMLLGLSGNDVLRGKKGKDKIGGGSGRDRLWGQGNNDLIAAVDGQRDYVQGGAGRGDRARVDRKDQVLKVEKIRRR